MIGNKYLLELYDYDDRDMSFNQLAEYLNLDNKAFIDSLKDEQVDINTCNSKEIKFLTMASAIIDYYLQIKNIEVPSWLRNEKLRFKKPVWYTKRIDDIDKFKLSYQSPAPFKNRNIFLDINGLYRV